MESNAFSSLRFRLILARKPHKSAISDIRVSREHNIVAVLERNRNAGCEPADRFVFFFKYVKASSSGDSARVDLIPLKSVFVGNLARGSEVHFRWLTLEKVSYGEYLATFYLDNVR